MANTGAAVINGVLSTLIAALCLSGSGTYVFITFFFALLFIVLCGAFSGLCVLPVLLDIFRPHAHAVVIDSSSGGDGNDNGNINGEPANGKGRHTFVHGNSKTGEIVADSGSAPQYIQKEQDEDAAA